MFGLVGAPLTCLILGITILLVLSKIYRVRGRRLLSIEVFIVVYLLRVGLVFFNENFLLFEHKYAGDFSLKLYQKYLLGIGGFHNISDNLIQFAKEQFALQALFNAPFFAFFGEELITILFTNSLFSALSGSVAAIILHGPFGEKVARRALILFSIYPASVNFSIFGLRDPLIYFFMTLFAVAAIAVYIGFSRRFHLVLTVLGAACVLNLRPELAYVIVALVGMLLLPSVLKLISPDQRPVERVAVAGAFLAVLATLGAALGVVSLKVAASQIGANTINPFELAGDRATERFERHDEDYYGGSHLLSLETYSNLPVYYRIPIQTAGLVVLPFPWMITSVAHALTFVDSLILMALMLLALLYARRGSRFAMVSFALLVAYCVAILGMGFIVSNAGNGFRMRFGVVPLCLLAASFSRAVPTLRLDRD